VTFNFKEELHKSVEDGCESICDVPRIVCVREREREREKSVMQHA